MNRYSLQQSGEVADSFTPPVEDADVTAQVLGSLCLGLEPEQILRRLLSVRSIISTASSFATRQQQTQISEELQNYRAIGQGTCGIVFEVGGFAHVLKKERDHVSQLWNDLRVHSKVLGAFRRARSVMNVRVPDCYGYVGREDSSWWSQNGHDFPQGHRNPGNLLFSERIPPLPRIGREALIDLYFPASQPPSRKIEAKQSQANKSCLARVYLGKRRDASRRPSQMFTLVNFNLHVDQMEELQLETEAYAMDMADALAVLHWIAKIDADDVEFVLGGAPRNLGVRVPDDEELSRMPPNSTTFGPVNFQRRAVHLWLLDFNRCQKMSMDETGVDAGIKAFFKNDPYYPRPLGESAKDQKLWEVFRDRYLTTSEKFDGLELAKMFIKKVVETRQAQLEAKANSQSRMKDSNG